MNVLSEKKKFESCMMRTEGVYCTSAFIRDFFFYSPIPSKNDFY